MKYLQREVAKEYGGLAYWHRDYGRETAPLLDELAAVLDHVNPHAQGGLSKPENLKTACNKCNSRRNDAVYADWIRRNPNRKNRGKEPLEWDGFSKLFVFLAKRPDASLTAAEKEWLEALGKESPPDFS